MQKFQILLLAIFFTIQLVNRANGRELQCSNDSSDNHELSFSLNYNKSEEGDWKTSFYSHQNTSHQPGNIDVNATRKSFLCQGNHVVQIRLHMKEINREQQNAKLTFKRCSKYAAITNDGRTLQKIKLQQSAITFTNRPLRDDEMMTVRIDALDDTHGKLGPAIGLTQLTFDGQELLDHANNYKSGTWMLYGSYVYQNGGEIYPNYLKRGLQEITVGQTIGVMRSRFGALHFFIDGVDQGPAASNIPDKVYGIFELRASKQGTIV